MKKTLVETAAKTQKRMKTLNFSLIIWLLIVMSLSSLLSFCVTYVFSALSVSKEVAANHEDIAGAIIRLADADMDAAEVADLMYTYMYPVEAVKDFSAYKMTDKQRTQLNKEGISYIGGSLFGPRVTLLDTGNGKFMISSDPAYNPLNTTTLRNALTLVFAIGISAGCMTAAFKFMLKPLHALSHAAQQVAGGDFDVRLAVENDDEFGRLSQSFNSMVEELGNIDTLRRDFMNNVSHEFKTPLASIYGFAELLDATPLTAEQQEYLDIIKSEAARLTRLSGNILQLSRLDTQRIMTNRSAFSLDEQLRRTVLLLENEWTAKNVLPELELEPIRFFGNEELLQQVWINIINNAIKYSNDGGMVHISCVRKQTHIEVAVSDEGIGMDQKTQARIFERFFQGETSRASEGCGLGLALANQIVTLFGGTIAVKSEVEKGSTFTVTLPA